MAKRLWAHTFFVSLGVIQREFLRNYLAYRAQRFRDNWNCYALSIFRNFILLASSDNDKPINANEVKNVNKYSLIETRVSECLLFFCFKLFQVHCSAGPWFFTELHGIPFQAILMSIRLPQAFHCWQCQQIHPLHEATQQEHVR